ncbi:MAG: uroporphyrinogen-III synthase, partial [Bacteroidota bacterium]
KSVFITRFLAPDSDFRQILENEGFQVEGQSLIAFQAVPFEQFQYTDWIFFYSKNAVRYFLEGISVDKQVLKSKLACMGKATATALEKLGRQADFVGYGSPDEIAADFLKLAKNQSVLFPRARNSRQSIQKILGNHIISYDLVVYINEPKTDCHMSNNNVLVFTSPLNVEAYFYQNDLQPHQRIVAIGETTAQALKKLGYCEASIASLPTEKSMATTVLQLASA